MKTDRYKIEWILNTDDDLSQDEKKQLVVDLAEELGAEDEIEYGGQVKRKSVTAFDVSVGILLVSSLNTAINIYKILQERDDSDIGIRQVNNEMFYIDEVDPTIIENNGGTVIENVEGDVFFTLPDDMEQQIQLKAEIREQEGEEDEGSE